MLKVRFKSLPAPFHRSNLHVTRLKGCQRTAPHCHDFFEVFLVIEGEGTHHLGPKKIALQRGDLVALRPEDSHWFSTTGAQSLAFANLALAEPWWRAFHALLGLEPWLVRPLAIKLNDADTTHLGDEIIRVGDGRSPLALSKTLGSIHHHLTRSDSPAADIPPLWLENLRRELAANAEALAGPISFWQKRSGRSPEHLARSCRRYYGVTFSELINQARVERAMHMLRTTDAKIITIAFDCGFGCLANFHRVFARQTARSPGRWRQEAGAAVPVHPLA